MLRVGTLTTIQQTGKGARCLRAVALPEAKFILDNQHATNVGVMMDYETIDYKGYKIKVMTDDSPSDPRDDDNLGTMVCFHSRYNLGDKNHGFTRESFIEFLEKNKDEIIALHLYLLDHSGLTMSTGRFACDAAGWDTSYVGLIYITKEKARKEYGRLTKKTVARIEGYLKAEVETYDALLTGSCYGYQVVDKDGNEIADGSCWGYYGYDHTKSGLLESAQYAIDYEIKRVLKDEGIQESLVLA